MKTDMLEVVPDLAGGLGNQMFQIAMAHVFARQLGGVVGLDDRLWRSLGQGQGPASYCEGMFSRFRRTRLREGSFEVHESQWKPGCRPTLRLPAGVSQVRIRGYWQLPALWECDHEEIRGLFQFAAEQTARAGVHIRGGDYVASHLQCGSPYHRQPGLEYYEKAITNLSCQPHFYSDDPAFVRRMLPEACPVPGSEADHFREMAECAELILSKSTFAWWAAFLGMVPLVIMPAAWFWNGEYQPSWAMRIDGWKISSPNSILWDRSRWHRGEAEQTKSSGTMALASPEEWSPWEYLTEILNDVICLVGASTYFEVGRGTGENFRAVECRRKVAVDLSDGANPCDSPLLRMEAEDFLASNREVGDLIFVKGEGSPERFSQLIKLAIHAAGRSGVVVCDGLKDADKWFAWANLAAWSKLVFIGVNSENGVGLVIPRVVDCRRGDAERGESRIRTSAATAELLQPGEARRTVCAVLNGRTLSQVEGACLVEWACVDHGIAAGDGMKVLCRSTEAGIAAGLKELRRTSGA